MRFQIWILKKTVPSFNYLVRKDLWDLIRLLFLGWRLNLSKKDTNVVLILHLLKILQISSINLQNLLPILILF